MSDPWIALRAATRARIGLGRTGDALPVKDVLEFQLAHARARDAVHTPLDTGAIAKAVMPLPSLMVRSQAADRTTYLRRPDLGRRLDPACRDLPAGAWDAVFVIADGLSPVGVQQHAVPFLRACLARLSDAKGASWTVAPVVIATQARVALGDEIGFLLGAGLCVMLIGERPGLSVSNSLGVYLTYHPMVGRRDSQRNCISNIHADGASYAMAADMLTWLMTEARQRRLSGVGLKDDRVVAATDVRSFPTGKPLPVGGDDGGHPPAGNAGHPGAG